MKCLVCTATPESEQERSARIERTWPPRPRPVASYEGTTMAASDGNAG